MIINDSKKSYERPESGTFLGTIVDVYDFVKEHPQYGRQTKVRIFWVLNANGTDGKPLSVKWDGPAKMSAGSGNFKPSNLYKMVQSIVNATPTLPLDTESLIGRSNQLFIVRTAPDAQGNLYANVVGVSPLPQGAVPPPIPVGFVRNKDRVQGGTAVQSAAPAAQPQAAAGSVGTTQTSQSTTYGAVNPAPAPQPASVVEKADVAF